MDHLTQLESESIYIIREAYKKFDNMAILWSMGKDSTCLLWLVRKAFFGKIPFKVLHVDTTFKFPEMYEFRSTYAKEWDFNLLLHTNQDAIAKGINYTNNDPFTCCHELKTVALQQAVEKHKFNGLIVGIRRDEEGSRAKERYFSPRNEESKWDYKDQPPEFWGQFNTSFKPGTHVRVHPLLHWTEVDIWRYIERENIPSCSLYFSQNGKRYRSLGCMPITTPINSNATTVKQIIEELKATKETERSGRKQDTAKEYAMQKLRKEGYM
ncbi:sulfate adenylyltransferase [archaeon]|nr:sulfate adenylyltransferase [archaeon]